MSVIFPSEFESRVFGQEGVEEFRQRIEHLDSPLELVYETDSMMRWSRLRAKCIHAAMGIEPYDTGSKSYDVSHKAASSYYSGAMFAQGGLLRLTTVEQRQAMAAIELPSSADQNSKNLAKISKNNIQAYLGVGRAGFADAIAYHDLFAEQEDEISPDGSTIGAARAGFGLPFYLLSTAIEAELSSIISNVDSESWDSALAELIGNPEK